MAVFRYAYYPCAIPLGVFVVASALDASGQMVLASAAQSLDGATELAWKSLLEKLSFSMYSGAEDTRRAYDAIVANAERHARHATMASFGLATITMLQLAWVRWRPGASRQDFAWHATLVSGVAFGVGIAAPMLTVLAYSSLPVLGTVVLKYDTKSIISTVTQLYSTHNVLLAALIAVFSIVLPLLKMSLMIAALAPISASVRTRSIHIMQAVGKWSMADVFVVGVLVAFLAISKDEFSDARIEPGLYYFAAYCILSMIAAGFIDEPGPPARQGGVFRSPGADA